MGINSPRLLTLFSALLLAGCPDGKDPPSATPTIDIAGGSFLLGSSTLACSGDKTRPELERCDRVGTGAMYLKMDKLSWVPRPRVTLGAFRMDAHEVTNLQFSYCVESGECDEPEISEVGGESYYGNADYDHHPVVHVSQANAQKYCAFIGGKLPNEAQWEVAARQDRSQKKLRDFPFPYPQSLGSPSCSAQSKDYLLSRDCGKSLPMAVRSSLGDTTELELRDMAGNVSEWIRDDWRTYAYCTDKLEGLGFACQTDPACEKCKDNSCVKSCAEDKLWICKPGPYKEFSDRGINGHVVRGGSYQQGPCFLRLYTRRAEFNAKADIGFRCVLPSGKPAADLGPTPDRGADGGPPADQGPDTSPSTDQGADQGADSGQPADLGTEAGAG